MALLVTLPWLSACGRQEAKIINQPVLVTAAPAAEPTPTPTPAPTPEPTPEPARNPLTGLPIDEACVGRRPVAVSVNNLQAALPQEGIGQADMLWEVVTEGGITRILAVYQDPADADVIGSVRSARTAFLDIAQGLDAVLVHCGGQKLALQEISDRGMETCDAYYVVPPFYRDEERQQTMAYEHTLMTTGSGLRDWLDNSSGFRLTHDGWENPMVFEENALIYGQTANTLSVEFSSENTVTFSYDEISGKYLVSQYGGQAQVDGATGEQLAMDNVVLIFADEQIAAQDGYYNIITLTGSGDARIFCGGQSAAMTWSKAGNSSPFSYIGSDGQTQVFRAGRTFFCIVDPDDPVSWE